MFKGFTDATASFFWDLQFNNERPWFQEHREEFEINLNQPFKDLGKDTFAILEQRYPLSDFELHLSRIYRDARRLFGRGPYKDNLWFSIRDPKNGGADPAFFFEITPRGWCFGLGFYSAKASEMEAFRKSIDANPERFKRLAASVARMKEFVLEGPEYKRAKGDYGKIVNEWYNRRYVSVVSEHDYDDWLMSEELPRKLADAFAKLMPMFEYLNQYTKEVV